METERSHHCQKTYFQPSQLRNLIMSESDTLNLKLEQAKASAQRPLRVTDAEFAMRNMHDSFIAAQVRHIHLLYPPLPSPFSHTFCFCICSVRLHRAAQRLRCPCSPCCPAAWPQCLKRRTGATLLFRASRIGFLNSRSCSAKP